MVSGCLAKIVSSDTRHNFLLHYLAALGVVLLTPVIFGVSRLDELLAAQPLEFFLPLMGAILMPAVFMPEQNESIREVVRSKKTPYLGVCFMRLLCGAIVITALTGAFVLYMKSMDSVVTMRLFAGSLASTFALGAAGFFASAVSDNVIVGYMTAVIYYICNFGLKAVGCACCVGLCTQKAFQGKMILIKTTACEKTHRRLLLFIKFLCRCLSSLGECVYLAHYK